MTRPPRPTCILLKDGVAASCLALPHWPRQRARPARLLDYLAERLPVLSQQEWAERMAQGEVLDERGQPLAATAPFVDGARIYYWRWLADEPEIPFEACVIHRDEHLLIVDKPHFLPVTPGGRYARQTLMARLRHAAGSDEPVPLHRLDRETAGLVAFSVNPRTRGAYHQLFHQQAVRKVYEALAPWRDELASGGWRRRRSRIVPDPAAFFRQIEVAGEPNSETGLRLVEPRPQGLALYRLEPLTGRTHQLRVHLAALGAPIVGDQFYPVVRHGPRHREDFSQPLQLLARGLAFVDPLSGQERRFESARTLGTD